MQPTYAQYPTKSSNKKLKGLPFLRFVAAFWIFLFHIDMRLNLSLPEFVKNIVTNGPVAMSFFFMLSGFVLSYRYSSNYGGFVPFYVARIARIYPAYLFCVILCLPLMGNLTALSSIKMIISVAFLCCLTIFLLQAWYPHFFSVGHFAGTWAISVEMFLYALYPMTRRLEMLNKKGLLLVILLSVAFLATLVPSLKLPITREILPFSVYYASPVYRLPEFVLARQGQYCLCVG